MIKNRIFWRIFQIVTIIVILVILWNMQRTVENSGSTLHEVLENGAITKPVLISVYYEALCPDSKSFIIKQLSPAYEKGARFIDVELIPYGKARTKVYEDHYEFECQHSYVECEANKIHACVIYYVPKTLERIRYVACMIQNNNEPDAAGSRCADELGVDYRPIRACAQSDKGAELLKQHGERTHALSPRATFIPTVVIDNSQEISSLPALLKDLFGEICKQFKNVKPRECVAEE